MKKVADYARIYGFRTYTRKSIRNHEEDYTRIGRNCYMANDEFAMLEEILESEN